MKYSDYIRQGNTVSYHGMPVMTDEEILLSTHLAKMDDDKLQLKYAALILFGTEDAITELMPRYRFEAVFYMCTYAQYNDMNQESWGRFS